jgi:hypothetical protein
MYKTKLRHVDIQKHWLRQEIINKTISLAWISINNMPADGFTKVLSSQKFEAFKKQLNMVDIASKIQL